MRGHCRHVKDVDNRLVVLVRGKYDEGFIGIDW